MRRDDIVRLFEHHDAVLHDVREGVLIVDGTGRLMLINDEARRRLAIAAGAEVDGQLLEEIGLESGMAELFTSNRPLSDAPAGSTGRPRLRHRPADRLPPPRRSSAASDRRRPAAGDRSPGERAGQHRDRAGQRHHPS
jgi:hypothetical protein